MASQKSIDLRAAINAISDVVENRPRPIRRFDQIYMKTGDLVLQSELVADWATGKKLAFIGDGDAVSVAAAYLRARKILDYGPTKITVFDFDERICEAVVKFAQREQIRNLDSQLYNCMDPFPKPSSFDYFYTNPPWGASNAGESVKVFVQRGMEATGFGGRGLVVIADGDEHRWSGAVLANVQRFAIDSNYFVSSMAAKMHAYHLDDEPDLKSCNLFITALDKKMKVKSEAIHDEQRLLNFYGQDNNLRIRYVRSAVNVELGTAPQSEYTLEPY